MAVQHAPRILLIEDDLDTAELIRETLSDHFGVETTKICPRSSMALEQDLSKFDLVLTDINLPDGSGLDLIANLLDRRRDIPIIVVTSESALDNATYAIQQGAYDYVVKSGDFLFTIPLIVEKNLAVWRVKVQNMRLQAEIEQTAAELRVKNNQLKDLISQLEKQATTDPLTNLSNRRHIQETLERSFSEALRYRTDLACLMIDLDGFKELNDTLGHQMGDRLLETTARVLTTNSRRCDITGRYGGDEFVVLMPHTTPTVAQQVAKRIKYQFVTIVRSMLPKFPNLDLSIGIACISISTPPSADHLVAMADDALYQAKQAGKAQIITYDKSGALVEIPGEFLESDSNDIAAMFAQSEL